MIPNDAPALIGRFKREIESDSVKHAVVSFANAVCQFIGRGNHGKMVQHVVADERMHFVPAVTPQKRV